MSHDGRPPEAPAVSAGEAPRPRRPWLKRRLALYVLILAIPGSLTLTTAVLESAWAGARLARLIESLAADEGLLLTIGDLRLQPWHARVVVRDAALSGGPHPLESATVSWGAVTISRRALLSGALRLVAIEAKGLDVRVVDDPATEPPPSDRAADLRPIASLRRVHVEGARLHYRDLVVELGVDVEDLALDGAPIDAGTGGVFSFARARVVIEDRPPLDLGPSRARFAWRAPELTIDAIDVRAPGVSAEGRARVLLGARGVSVEADARGAIDLAWAATGALDDIEGSADYRARVDVHADRPWSVKGEVLGVAGARVLGLEIARARADFTAGPDGVFVREGEAETAGGSRVSSVDVGWNDGAWSIEGELDADVSEALRWQDLDPQLGSGRLAADFDASQRAPAAPLSWSLEGDLRDAQIGPGEAPLEGRIVARAGMSDGGLDFVGTWAGGAANAAMRWDERGPQGPWSLDARLGGDSLDAARALAERVPAIARLLDLTLPTDLALETEGRIRVDIDGAGQGASFDDVRVYVDAESLRVAEDRAGRLEGVIEAGDRARGGFHAVLRLAADESGRGATFIVDPTPTGGVRLTVDASRMPVSWIGTTMRIFGEQTPLELDGTLDGHARSDFELEGVHARVVASGTAQPLWLAPGAFRVSADLKPQGARIDDLEITSTGLLARFTGTSTWPSLDEPERDHARLDLHGQAEASLALLAPGAGASGVGGRVRFAGGFTVRDAEHPPIADGRLVWQDVSVDTIRVPAGRARFDASSENLLVDVQAAGIEAEARISGALADPELVLRATWKDLEIVSFVESVTGEALGLTMAAWSAGSLSVEGPLVDPLLWEGQARLTGLDLVGPSVSAKLAAPVSVVLARRGRAVIDEADPARIVDDLGDTLDVWGAFVFAGVNRGTIDLVARGAADLQVFEVFASDLVARGRVDVDLRVQGPIDDPELVGEIAIDEGRVRLLTLREAIDALSVRVLFDGASARIEHGTCEIGGGQVRLGGAVGLDGFYPSRLDLSIDADDVAITAPDGVWGRYDAALTLRGSASEPELAGSVQVLAGRVTRSLGLGLNPWQRRRRIDPTWSLRDWSQGVSLRLTVRSDHVLALRVELARAEAALALEVGGTIAYPILSGNATVLEGGRLTFRGVEYEIYAGQVVFEEHSGGPMRVRLRGGTDVAGYRITLEIDATFDQVDYTLRSVPPLPESDILSLLVTGQTLADAGSQASSIASDAAATYFGSGLGDLLLSEPAKRALGLTEFRIGTARVGPEARPTARVTLGRRIDDRTLVLYSRDLSNEGRDVYRVEHDITRTLRIGAGRETSGGIASDLRWIYRFAEQDVFTLGASAEDRVPPGLASLTIDGLPSDVRAPRRRALGLSRGTAITRSAVILAAEEVRARLVEAGYLEARVTYTRTPEDRGNDVDVRFVVDPGPPWIVDVTGPSSIARDATERLVELWAGTQFRPTLLDEAALVLQDALADDGYATGLVEVERPDPGERAIRVTIDPGPRVTIDKLTLLGIAAFDPAKVRDQVLSRPGGLLQRTNYRPRTLETDIAAILTLYESRGYLETRVTPRVRFTDNGKKVEITLVVVEGRPFTFDEIRVEGEWPAELGSATARIAARKGDIFTPETLRAIENRLRADLDAAGYFRARVTARPDVGDGEVDLTLRVRAETKAEVAEIVIEGLDRTREKIVRRAIQFRVGAPLTSRDLSRSERELFRLGLFRKVEIDPEPLPDDPGKRRMVVRVVEQPPISVLLSAGYDTEEKLRGSATLSHENLFGMARVGSIQLFASSLRQALRATLEDRYLARGRIEGLLSVGPETEEKDGFTVRRWQGTFQIGRPERRRERWQLRYQVQRTTIADVTLDEVALRERLDNEGLSEDSEWLAGVIGAYIVDRRDDPFLPSEGWLARSELGVWAGPLGSDSDFVRFTGQLAAYQPLTARVGFAGSLRVGAGWTFGSTASIPASERFFAGGAETIRGFERDRLGPFDPVTGLYLGGGGEAQWIGNLELRFLVYPKIELAFFHDSGNVWARLDDFDLSDMRQTYGLGLRWRSPVGLLRAEYGRKIERREDESAGEWFISIGEAW